MKKTIVLLKAWVGPDQKELAAGTRLEVDAETFKTLTEGGIAKEFVPDTAPATAPDQTAAIRDMVRAGITDALAAMRPAGGTPPVTVKDNSDSDPLFGYGPEGHSMTRAEALKPENRPYVMLSFGRFAAEVSRVRDGVTARLQKCAARWTDIQRKAAGTGLVIGTDEDGGYLVMPAAMAMIQQATVEAAVIRPRAAKFTLGTKTLTIPLMRDENRTSGQVYNGIRVYWESELSQLTESRPKLRMLKWELHKLAALGYASNEWIKWSPMSVGSFLIPRFGEAIGYAEDLAFINGKGGGQPLGLRNAACKISITKESGQNADTLVLANTLNMLSRLRRLGGGAGSVWLMNQMLQTQLPLLNLEVGTGGSAVFINSATGAMPMTLWGLPIVFCEKLPALGDAGDVVLTDLSDYVIADDTGGPEIAESMHLKFDYDQAAFRITKYVDGQNLTDTAFTPYQAGSTAAATLSPVIELGERA